MNNPAQYPDPNRPPQLRIFPKRTEPERRRQWLRIVGWVFGGIAAFLFLIVIAFVVVINTPWFHNYALNLAQRKASQYLSTQVQLQNFTLHLSSLSLDIYGLTIHGADPYPDPPLLELQHATVGIRITSVLRRKWYLSNLEIDHPVVNIFNDAQGNSNIPKIKSSGPKNGNNTNTLFDLGIRHAVLTKGDVSYNNKKSSLSADLHDVEFLATFDVPTQKYSGRLSYINGSLTANAYRTIQHDLDATFDATPTTFHLSQARLNSGHSHFNLTATIENYNSPSVQAHYDASIDGSDVRRVLGKPTIPAGIIYTSGSVNYRAIPDHPALDAVVLNGSLHSQRLDLQTSSLHTQISDIAAQYSLANGNANVQSLRAHLLGGELTATAQMVALTGNSHSQVNASLTGVSLAEIQGMVRRTSVPQNLSLNGELNGKVNAEWGKSIQNLVAHADVAINGQMASSNPNKTAHAAVPLNSEIHGEYRADNEQFALNQSYIRMPETTLTMNGVMSKHSDLTLHFQSNDLHEVDTIASIFQNSGQTQSSLNLGGKASFDGNLNGSTKAPHLTGQVVATNLQIKGTNWRQLRTNLDLSPSSISVHNGQLLPASQGNITFNASAGLRKWKFSNDSPIQLSLNATRLNISDLLKAGGSQVPVTGVLSVNLNMHGDELHPYGQGQLALTRGTVYQEPVQSAQLTFSGTGNLVNGHLLIGLAAGDLQSTFSLNPQQKSYVAQLSANNFQLEKLKTLQTRNIGIGGTLNLQASGQGTFQNPQLTATLQSPKIGAKGQTITGLNLQLNVANRLAVANLTSEAVNTSIRANAKVNLTGDYQTEANFDTQTIPLQPLASIYLPAQAQNISGQTEVHATLNGPLKNRKLLEAHIRIPVLKMGYGNSVQLASVSPIQADYKDGVLSVQRGTIRGTDTDLQFQGAIPTGGNTPMSLLLLGTVDLHLAELLNPDVRSSGQLRFNINSFGASSDPNVEGQIQIVNANFANGELPVGLQHGNGVLTLTKNRLNISQFHGIVGGGEVTAQGGVMYRPSMQFDLGLLAKGIRVLYPQGVRETVDANLRFAGSQENSVLGGTVNLTDLSFTPAFDLTNFIGQFAGGVAGPPSQGFAQNVQLNLAVNSSNNINLVSRTLSINGTANLQVRGTAAQPVLLGRVGLNGGDLIFHGDRFVLNGGTIQFVNPAQTEPVVNLTLNTTIQQYNIYLRFNGPINELHTNYSSDPSLPAADIINLLAFGQTTEASAANPSMPANQAAESLVASQVSSQITSRVSKIAGISQLSINPVLSSGTSQGPPGANVTIQQRVTGNLFVTFSSNLASTQNQIIMGQYQLSPRVAVSVTRDQNGGFAVDTQIKKTW